MNTFTVIAYDVPAGGHHIETLEAPDATSAAVAVRDRLGLAPAEFEVVAVARGCVEFEEVDHARVTLAPFSPASP